MTREFCLEKLMPFFLCVLAFLFQGCISFATGPERNFLESATKHQLSVRSVSRVRAKVERSEYDASYYTLKLVAEGRFVRHTGHSMKKGTPCLAVGLWPGCADSKNKGLAFFGSIILNYGLAGIPTLVSLLFEPFRDYRERTATGFDLADIGLLGFNKYYRDVSKDQAQGFVTESTEDLSSYELFGYSVMIDGVRYEDKDYGTGCRGEVYFRTTRSSGSRITIRIVEVPAARSDGEDGFAGMMGMEIPATIP